jgi:hypothetical protein
VDVRCGLCFFAHPVWAGGVGAGVSVKGSDPGPFPAPQVGVWISESRRLKITFWELRSCGANSNYALKYDLLTLLGLLMPETDHPIWPFAHGKSVVPLTSNGLVQEIGPVDGGLKLLSAACNSPQHHPTRARPEIGESHRPTQASQGILRASARSGLVHGCETFFQPRGHRVSSPLPRLISSARIYSPLLW